MSDIHTKESKGQAGGQAGRVGARIITSLLHDLPSGTGLTDKGIFMIFTVILRFAGQCAAFGLHPWGPGRMFLEANGGSGGQPCDIPSIAVRPLPR